jgi:hypothetical protein
MVSSQYFFLILKFFEKNFGKRKSDSQRFSLAGDEENPALHAGGANLCTDVLPVCWSQLDVKWVAAFPVVLLF